jgi:ethanolamine utilization protein EutQ (cupin superfamily)
MEIKIIKKSEAEARKINETYKVVNFLTRDISENVSLAIGHATNHSETTKNIRSDRVYYILDGRLMIKQNDKDLIAEQGDVIFIPKNTEYHFEGTFKTILVNSPAFNLQDEKTQNCE